MTAHALPRRLLAIVALCNGATIAPTELTRKVADIYLLAQMSVPALVPALAESRGTSAPWAGTYWSAATDEVVRLEWKEGALRQSGTAMHLVRIGSDVYRPSDMTHEWRFAASGAQAELRIRDFWPTTRLFTRVSESPPSPSALNAFAGRYYSSETDMRYTVRMAEGRLRLSWPRQYDLPLEAVGGNRFVSSLGTVTFTQNAGGAIDGLTISNRRLRKFHAPRLAEADR